MVELNQPLDRPLPEKVLNRVEVLEVGEKGFTFRTNQAQQDNPAILRCLASEELAVVTLSEIPRSLESAYLKIAGQPLNDNLNRDEIEKSLEKIGSASPEGTLHNQEVGSQDLELAEDNKEEAKL